MPVYEYQCTCGSRFDRFLRLAQFQEPQNCPSCGNVAEKRLSAPAVRGDYAPYRCPVSGKMIEGRKAHNENLARHGCRVLETGEREVAARARRQAETQLEESVAETAAHIVANLDSSKREALETEVSRGVDIDIVRQTA